MQGDFTTLVCLFHHEDQARAAVRDLRGVSIPQAAISIIGGDGSGLDALDKSDLSSLGMPDRDYDHLKEGIRKGDIVVAVSSIEDHVSAVELIFSKYSAEKIDEARAAYRDPDALAAAGTLDSETAIPIVEEAVVVSKQTVDRGGVRLYSRVVEVPVEESVQLHEEHISVNRYPVDRAVTNTDLAFQPQTIELTETTEQAVVGKVARVVEEIVLSKEATAHTETVHDTVRHTEVDVEELPGTHVAAGEKTSTY